LIVSRRQVKPCVSEQGEESWFYCPLTTNP
jgi:hypothetical protein